MKKRNSRFKLEEVYEEGVYISGKSEIFMLYKEKQLKEDGGSIFKEIREW